MRALARTICSVIGNCCNVVLVKQEFRKKFLPKCVLAHTTFDNRIKVLKGGIKIILKQNVQKM